MVHSCTRVDWLQPLLEAGQEQVLLGQEGCQLTQINYSVQKSPSTAYNLYQAGKLDGTILDVQASKQLTKSKGYTIRKVANTQYLQFNLKKYSKFKSTNLRRGISMAINRSSLSKTLGATYKAATMTLTSSGLTTVNGEDFIHQAGRQQRG